MPKHPVVTSKKFVSALNRLGFSLLRQKGSHAILVHADGRMAVVPMHAKDLPIGTLHGILGDIDLSVDDLVAVL